MEPTKQTDYRLPKFLHRFERFLVAALLVYAAGAFVWVFRYQDELRDSFWFGLYCCAPLLAVVVWIWSEIRRRHRQAKPELERKDDL
jgi:FtsH-binding integral membrane protein